MVKQRGGFYSTTNIVIMSLIAIGAIIGILFAVGVFNKKPPPPTSSCPVPPKIESVNSSMSNILVILNQDINCSSENYVFEIGYLNDKKSITIPLNETIVKNQQIYLTTDANQPTTGSTVSIRSGTPGSYTGSIEIIDAKTDNVYDFGKIFRYTEV
jgi:hypothetical protein